MQLRKKKLGMLITGILSTANAWAGCGISNGGNPALAVNDGEYCNISESNIWGANVAWVVGEATVNFEAPDVELSSFGGQPHVLGIGGSLKAPKLSGSTAYFANNVVINLSDQGWARGIYMWGVADGGLPNTLYVPGNLKANLYTRLGGAGLELSSAGNFATIEGDYISVHKRNLGDGIRNEGDLSIYGSVLIGSLNGSYAYTGVFSRNSGTMSVDGDSKIYSSSNAIESLNNSSVNFNGKLVLNSRNLANISNIDTAKVKIKNLTEAKGPSFLDISGGSVVVNTLGTIDSTSNAINFNGGQVNMTGGKISSAYANVINVGTLNASSPVNSIVLTKSTALTAGDNGSVIFVDNRSNKASTISLKQVNALSSGASTINVAATNTGNTTINLETVAAVNNTDGLLTAAGSGKTTLNFINSNMSNMSAQTNNDINVSGGTVDVNLRASYANNAFNKGSAGVLNVNIDKNSTLNMVKNSTFTQMTNLGKVYLDDNVLFSSLNGNVTNGGLIQIDRQSSGSGVNKTLTINGNYHGNYNGVASGTAGVLGLAVLPVNGDASPASKLIINGNSSGNTRVDIKVVGTNVPGTPTLNGIEVIRVNGSSDGNFTQGNAVSAGAYDYVLARGANSQYTSNKNWYLTNHVVAGKAMRSLRSSASLLAANIPTPASVLADDIPALASVLAADTPAPASVLAADTPAPVSPLAANVPAPASVPTDDIPAPVPVLAADVPAPASVPADDVTASTPLLAGGFMPVLIDDGAYAMLPFINIYRPEIGSYASNIQAANTLFNLTLHDRLGETQYTNALSGEREATSLWLRQVGGHKRSNMAGGQLKTTANRYVAQLGADIAQWSHGDSDRFHLGIMGGYANQHSSTMSNITKSKSKGVTTGYSTGLYGTWYANENQDAGLYVDGWVQYNWFNHTVNRAGNPSEKYKSRGLSASVETGYTFLVSDRRDANNEGTSFYLQPQAQVTWMGVKAHDRTDGTGTRIASLGDNNIQTRLGTRAYLKGHSALDKGKNRDFEPFVEANWIYNSKQFGVDMGGVSQRISGTRHVGEVKVGVEGKINRNVNLWGNVGQQIGREGYRDTQGTLGLKYMF